MDNNRLPFQSTRPIRGATCGRPVRRHQQSNFNPRAPYGARLACLCCCKAYCSISIHAPHTGRDGVTTGVCITPPFISIHAPHTGRDVSRLILCLANDSFQSTRPIRGATRPKIPIAPPISNFNPRAPYGARRPQNHLLIAVYHFNPRAPYGARHDQKVILLNKIKISIHAPHTGRDSKNA